MRILVDHLTRMAAGYVCVAGLDDDGRHIRPVIKGHRLPTDLTTRSGGPFSLGAVIDLGPTQAVGTAPEVEDHLFEPDRSTRVTDEDADRLWELMTTDAELALIDIFGQDLHNERRGAVVPIGAGRVSLGTLNPGYRPRVQITNGRLRCVVTDPTLGVLDLSVTDLRFYIQQDTGWVIDLDAVRSTQDDLESGRPTLLSVGLGRPWPQSNPMHWLQVNGVHREPDPELEAPSYRLEEIREVHPNAYTPWTEEDETLLTLLFKRGTSVQQMADILERQEGGITSRLKRLGLVE